MDTIKKRNRIILCICSILVIFASILSFIPLNKNNKMVVKADTVTNSYSFTGSTIPILFSQSFTDESSDPNNITYLFMENDIRDIAFNIFIDYSGQLYFNFGFYTGDTILSFKIDDNRRMGAYYLYSVGNIHYFISLDVLHSSNVVINNGVVSNFGKPIAWSLSVKPVGELSDIMYQTIYYYDVNDNYIAFRLSSKHDNPIIKESSTAKYYFGEYEFSDNESYNAGYNTGYNEGYSSGLNSGNNAGFENGYNVGKNDGYNLGYNTALENDHYTFTNLISAVIDVPVRTFTSLFNFEILGVNLSGFFLGLLTCCIVIGVVRLIL